MGHSPEAIVPFSFGLFGPCDALAWRLFLFLLNRHFVFDIINRLVEGALADHA